MKFSKEIPELQLQWSASSFKTLQECPRKYYYENILRRVPAKTAIELIFGKLFHDGIEIFTTEYYSGMDFDYAVNKMLKTLMVTSQVLPDDKHRNRPNLIRSLVWFALEIEHNQAKPITMNGEPAIEVPYSIPLGSSMETGEDFMLEGYFDAIVDIGEVRAIKEYKTTTRGLDDNYFDSFSPNTQITCYAYAAQIAFNPPINQVYLHGTLVGIGFTAFATRLISRNAALLNEFSKDLEYYLQQAEHFAVQGYWPKNESACFRCNFKEVCKSTPSVREGILLERYVPKPLYERNRDAATRTDQE